MKNRHYIIAAALLMGSAPIPALSAVPDRPGVENLGTVDVGGRPDRDVIYNRFGGPMEGLRLRATESDINCRSVVARFGNGRSRQIFSGRLPEGQSTNVDLPGDSRRVTSLTFNCRAQERWGGKIRILADVGRYRGDWMRSPDWAGVWSRLFSFGDENRANDHAMGGRNRGGWMTLGEESFEGRGDREVAYAGWRGNDLRAIALMPVETDARCRRVRADFARGSDQDLNAAEHLRQGQYNRVDLPGDRRDLVSLRMNCRAEGRRDVTIRLYGLR